MLSKCLRQSGRVEHGMGCRKRGDRLPTALIRFREEGFFPLIGCAHCCEMAGMGTAGLICTVIFHRDRIITLNDDGAFGLFPDGRSRSINTDEAVLRKKNGEEKEGCKTGGRSKCFPSFHNAYLFKNAFLTL